MALLVPLLLLLLLLLLPLSPHASDSVNFCLGFDQLSAANRSITPCRVRPEFLQDLSGVCGAQQCSLRCAAVARCQAFQPMSSCRCRLFLFNKCSHGVRDSTAACGGGAGIEGDIFLRRLPGAVKGSLCPPGYSYSRNGSSYKLVSSPTANWAEARAACDADGGLAKLADIQDRDELAWLMSLRSPGVSYFVGGRQLVASNDKKANWVWDACNSTIDRSLWDSAQPDNGLPGQGCACLNMGLYNGLDDFACSASIGYICQCQPVF